VRQAVAEAELADVHPYCVTIDREGPGYLGRMFGPGRFTLLWNVTQLPERLPEVYRRLTAGA
jgi:nitric oxide reductase activation protein